jgi:copper transport protein
VTPRGRALIAGLAVAAAFLAAPAGAFAHAALLRTQPSASVTVNGSPAHVALTYSEAVEPRFAIVSVTDAAGHQQASEPPSRSKTNADQLVVPVKHLGRGWYLVYWRVISVDGHPVRGAFTFAVGPNPGPAPQFAIPSLRETAATPKLLIARWVAFLSLMAAIGLAVFRLFVARPLLRRVPESSLRAVSVALAVSLGVALVAITVYVDLATAQFAQRGVFDLGNLVPLMTASAFGRAWLDLEIVTALIALACLVAIRLDRPDREQRSVAELLALTGAGLSMAAALLMPGLSGHAAQYSPRGVSLVLDWTHMLAGSLWVGGLIGLTVVGATAASSRRVASFVVVVPRFSRLAFGSVLVLIVSGTIAAFIRFPTLSSLWQTGYGQALLVKIGLLLFALVLAAVNLLRSKPRLEASRSRPGLGESTASALRRLVGGEIGLVIGAIFAAGVLSSLAPPPKALAGIGKPAATVGPGAIDRTVKHGPYQLAFKITRGGKPVMGASVVAKFTMLDMEMQQQAYRLPPHPAPLYAKGSLPSLVMVGRWALTFTVTPPGAAPFNVVLVDHAQG